MLGPREGQSRVCRRKGHNGRHRKKELGLMTPTVRAHNMELVFWRLAVVAVLSKGVVDAGHSLLPGEAFNYHGSGYDGVMLPTDGAVYETGSFSGDALQVADHQGYTTRGGHYGSPPPRGGYHHHHYEGPPCGHGEYHDSSLMDALLHLGAAKLGMVGVVKGGVASLLSKLPWLLLKLGLKLLLLKLLTLPLLLPLLIPLATAFLPQLADKFSCCGGDGDDDDGNSTRSFARMAHRALAADRCFERAACELGALNAQSQHNKPVLWALSAMMRSDEGAERLRSYKEAYVVGLTERSCDNQVYPCDLNGLVRSMASPDREP